MSTTPVALPQIPNKFNNRRNVLINTENNEVNGDFQSTQLFPLSIQSQRENPLSPCDSSGRLQPLIETDNVSCNILGSSSSLKGVPISKFADPNNHSRRRCKTLDLLDVEINPRVSPLKNSFYQNQLANKPRSIQSMVNYCSESDPDSSFISTQLVELHPHSRNRTSTFDSVMAIKSLSSSVRSVATPSLFNHLYKNKISSRHHDTDLRNQHINIYDYKPTEKKCALEGENDDESNGLFNFDGDENEFRPKSATCFYYDADDVSQVSSLSAYEYNSVEDNHSLSPIPNQNASGPSSRGVHSMTAPWKKQRPNFLRRRKYNMKATKDTVTTAETSAIHTLETIDNFDVPSQFSGGDDVSFWGSMDRSPQSSNMFTSLHGYHRRCNGIKSSWIQPSAATSSPLSRGSYGSQQHVQWRNQIDLFDMVDRVNSYPSSVTPPTTCQSHIATYSSERSILSGSSSNGCTLKSGENYPTNIKASFTISGQEPHVYQLLLPPDQPQIQMPTVTDKNKTVTEMFDPLSEVGSRSEEQSSYFPLPPRVLNDCVVPTKSRYPCRMPPLSSQRYNSSVRSIENACMFGSIALSEASSPKAMHFSRRPSSSKSFDGINCQGTFDTLGEKNTPSVSSSSHNGFKLYEEETEDNRSCRSFNIELHRKDKFKVVTGEVKQFFGRALPNPKPVVKAGMKLFGREIKSESSLKRSGGSLT